MKYKHRLTTKGHGKLRLSRQWQLNEIEWQLWLVNLPILNFQISAPQVIRVPQQKSTLKPGQIS